MKTALVWIGAALAVMMVVAAAPSPMAELDWAYPGGKPPAPEPVPEPAPRFSLPGAPASFTEVQLHDLFGAVDWRPASHPTMPSVVATGRKPDVMACGFCHLPDGQGRPENASLAGLPKAYIAEQVQAFADGSRTSAHDWRPSSLMTTIAKGATPAEIEAAADYFSKLTFRSHVRVQETASLPRLKAVNYLLVPEAGAPEEPLGDRIAETPSSMERFEYRDPEVEFTAHVPVGSLARGEALAKTLACGACHGPALKGALGPPLAGRSPSYMFRQLEAFHSGARGGTAAEAMTGIAADLSTSDMVALAAYAGSLKP